MDGVHDLGGKPGFGSVEVDADGTFYETWEQRVFGLVNAGFRAGVFANTDQFRHAIERIDPASYLEDGYFGRWLGGLETVLVETGRLEQAHLTAAARDLGAPHEARVAARPSAQPDQISYPPAASSAARELESAPRFQTGARVRTQSEAVPNHTRLPGYARDRVGTVVSHHGGWVLPDTNAHGLGEQPTHLYTVMFDGVELWGDASEPGVKVHLDLFEPYLQPCEQKDDE